MKTPIVGDTNVVVAGIIGGVAASPVYRILDGMLSAAFPFLLSVELLDEYRRVLLRPAISKLHALSERRIDIVLTELTVNGVIRELVSGTEEGVPDPGDAHLWRLLRTSPGAILVTGNRALLANPPDFVSCITPRAFLALLDA